MKLTGKAKEDFSYKYNMSNFNEYSEVLQNALIIEFFDSVGIYISIEHNQNVGFMYILDECCENGFLTRKEAAEKAIEQANLIYNDRV